MKNKIRKTPIREKELVSLFIKNMADKGLSNMDLAESLGVGKSYISQIFSLNKRISLSYALKIGRLIGLPDRVVIKAFLVDLLKREGLKGYEIVLRRK